MKKDGNHWQQLQLVKNKRKKEPYFTNQRTEQLNSLSTVQRIDPNEKELIIFYNINCKFYKLII